MGVGGVEHRICINAISKDYGNNMCKKVFTLHFTLLKN